MANLRLVASNPPKPDLRWKQEVNVRVLAWQNKKTAEKAGETHKSKLQHPKLRAAWDMILTLMAAVAAFWLCWGLN